MLGIDVPVVKIGKQYNRAVERADVFERAKEQTDSAHGFFTLSNSLQASNQLEFFGSSIDCLTIDEDFQ
jgi:hypothetical protein